MTELAEELADDAAHERDRQEDDDVDHGDGDGGKPDLGPAVKRRLVGMLAQAAGGARCSPAPRWSRRPGCPPPAKAPAAPSGSA